MIAARQNVIVAEQILAPAIVLDQRAQRPAAAIGHRTPARVKIVIIPTGTA